MRLELLLVIPLVFGCGSTASGDLGKTGTSMRGQSETMPLDVVADDEVVLMPFDAEDRDFLVSTLAWNQDSGRCEILPGYQDEDAVAHFLLTNQWLDLFGVVPWELSLPKGVDPLDELKESEVHKFYLSNDGIRLTIEFSYVGTVITLRDVTLKAE